MILHKEEEKLIRSISLRVGELLDKQISQDYNAATPYAFAVGLGADVENTFKQIINDEIKFLEKHLINIRKLRKDRAGLQILQYPIQERLNKLKKYNDTA